MPSNQSQITVVDQPSEGVLPLQPPLVLDFTTARSTGFHSMTLHIYLCALIWHVSLCVWIYLTDAGFFLDLYQIFSLHFPQHRLVLVLDREDLIVMFSSSTISKKTRIITRCNFPQIQYNLLPKSVTCMCMVFIFRNKN